MAGADTYKIQIDNENTFTAPLEFDPAASASLTYTPPSNLAEGTHYWRVKAFNSSAVEIGMSGVRTLTIDTTPPGAPSPSSPTAGALFSTNPTLNWTAPSGGPTAYQVQIATDSGFASLVSGVPTQQSGTSYSTSALTLPPDHYYWHVRARDAAGNWGAYSMPFDFGMKPAKPSLTSPANGAVLSDGTPTFEWGTATGADHYEIQVDNSPWTSPEYQNLSVGTTSVTASLLAADGTYSWHVRAVTVDGDAGDWSSTRTFTLDRKPPKPTDLTPSGASNDDTPDFTWTGVLGETTATSYAITVKLGTTVVQSDADVTNVEAGCNADTTCVFSPPWTFADGAYSYTITPANSYGTGPAASGSFTVDTTAPDIPINSSPKNLSLVTKAAVTLKTKGVKTATNYDFKLTDNEDCASDPGLITGSNTKSNLPVDLTTYGYGVYYFCARASDAAGNISGWSYPHKFSYSLMKAPKDNSWTTDTMPSFKWGSYRGALTWEVRYGLNPELSGEPIYAGTSRGYTPLTPLPYGVYYWSMRIDGGSWMPVQKFTISNMRKPANNTVTSDTTPSFSWNTYTGAPGWDLAYTDNPDGDPTDGTNDTVISGLLGTAKSYTVPAPLPDGEYFWSVLDTGGSNWMPPAKFFITHMTAPKNESFSTKSTVAFKWKSVLDATGYHLYIDTVEDPTGATPVDLLPSVRSYKTTLGRVTRYYWTVVADTPGGPVTMPVFTFVVQ